MILEHLFGFVKRDVPRDADDARGVGNIPGFWQALDDCVQCLGWVAGIVDCDADGIECPQAPGGWSNMPGGRRPAWGDWQALDGGHQVIPPVIIDRWNDCHAQGAGVAQVFAARWQHPGRCRVLLVCDWGGATARALHDSLISMSTILTMTMIFLVRCAALLAVRFAALSEWTM